MDLKNDLKNLYLKTSKHSNYQILTEEIAQLLDIKENDIHSRYEKERFEYIKKNISLVDKKILDIGGNTGYFTFESLKNGCREIDYYEGNKEHAQFVEKAKQLFKDGSNIKVFPEYYLFNSNKDKYDIVYCLNVIHHLGSDFLNVGNKKKAKEEMINCINQLSYITEYLVLQIGFNWCGQRHSGLFDNGTKKEIEQFIENGTKENWQILKIGIPERHNNSIIYNDLTCENNIRRDEMGEFLNRPLFIMHIKN